MDVQAQMTTRQGGHRFLLTVSGKQIETPPLEHLAFYLALGALAQGGVLEVPIAVALGVGHVLIDMTRRPGLVAIGEALEEA
jgi:hypothetical protein